MIYSNMVFPTANLVVTFHKKPKSATFAGSLICSSLFTNESTFEQTVALFKFAISIVLMLTLSFSHM